jgi:hypothetical protein
LPLPRARARNPRVRRTRQRPHAYAARSVHLYRAVDNGPGLALNAEAFGGIGEETWGRTYESFLRLNESALTALGATARFDRTPRGPALTLHPGGDAGAIPLRSATTGQVVGGFIVKPRFGWTGVGSILRGTGWGSAPDVLPMPLVPGSGREVPPWVLAGPVIARLQEMLDRIKRGFDLRENTLRSPRGTIRWPQYTRESLPRGRWHHVPCRFPDLSTDPLLRGAIRWTLERVFLELTIAGGQDRVAIELGNSARMLLDRLTDVASVYPRPELFTRISTGGPLLEHAVRHGLDAIGWVRDEREMDGLAWALPLERLWEDHVSAQVAADVRLRGGVLRTGRRGETVTPLRWSTRSHHSLGHLAPDAVVVRGKSVWIVDAKYKSHFAEIDEHGWRQMPDEIRDRHRADLHQVLAYSALFDAPEITATLAYPLRLDTWQHLHRRGLDRVTANLYEGARHVKVELWGLPFGRDDSGLEVR